LNACPPASPSVMKLVNKGSDKEKDKVHQRGDLQKRHRQRDSERKALEWGPLNLVLEYVRGRQRVLEIHKKSVLLETPQGRWQNPGEGGKYKGAPE